MALTLVVQLDRWRAHLAAVVAERPDVVPVVKGNGYGFGRAHLVDECVRLGLDEVAVGTPWELADLPPGRTAVVLTPCAAPTDVAALTDSAVPTVGTVRDVDVLRAAGRAGAVVVKLRTSLRRYGVEPGELAGVLEAVEHAGIALHAFGVHFPLEGTAEAHAAELAAWLPRLPADAVVHVGHLGPTELGRLTGLGRRRVRPRTGTALWLGARDAIHLAADVVDVRPVAAGERVGYRQVEVGTAGHLVLVGAGTAHGVAPLDDGRSPFHHARCRLALVEPPHMHTSMCLVPAGTPCPAPGDRVDVQRPLTRVLVDRVEER